MPISSPFTMTECHGFFVKPATSIQRQYEALRAYFVEKLASAQVARRFGYTPAAFRMLCYEFLRRQLPDFFVVRRPGPREQPKKSKVRDEVVALRKRNYSIYDISRALKEQGTPLGATAVREILLEEGFARLPRRLDEERPARLGPTIEAVADVRAFSLAPREFTTRVGGLFLFIPDLVRLDAEALAEHPKLPGSQMIPPLQGLLAALALKLWSIERKSHIMALVADEGLGLFCGLNAIPKKSFLSEYSSPRTPPAISSATRMPTSARAKRPMRSSASSSSGPASMVRRRSTWCSIPSSPPSRGSIVWTRRVSLSSPCAGARRPCSRRSPTCHRRPGVRSTSMYRTANIAHPVSTSRKRAQASAPSASSSSRISATTSPPSCSPMIGAPRPN